MKKNTVGCRGSRVHFRPASCSSAILSRQGRRLWAGVQTPADEGLRMRNESLPSTYETLDIEAALDDPEQLAEATAGQFAVKPPRETAD